MVVFIDIQWAHITNILEIHTMTTSFPKQNPFSRPSLFKSINAPTISKSPSSLPYGSYTNIVESQVKPIVTGTSYEAAIGTGRPSLYGAYDTAYQAKQNLPYYATSHQDIGYAGTSARPDEGRGSARSNHLDNGLVKDNPFKRSSLLHRQNTDIAYQYSGNQVFPSSSGNLRSDTNESPLNQSPPLLTSYQHLRYTPGSSTKANPQTSIPSIDPINYSYSPVKQIEDNRLLSPRNNIKTNNNNYGDDRSDTGSVRSYINKITDMDEDGNSNPFQRRALINPKNVDDGIKNKKYSDALQYRNGGNTGNNNSKYPAIDRYKYEYQQQKKITNNQYSQYNDTPISNNPTTKKRANSSGKYDELEYKPSSAHNIKNMNKYNDEYLLPAKKNDQNDDQRYGIYGKYQGYRQNKNSKQHGQYDGQHNEQYDKYQENKYEGLDEKKYEKNSGALSDIQANRLIFKSLGVQLDNEEDFNRDKRYEGEQTHDWRSENRKNGYSEKYIGKGDYQLNIRNENNRNSMEQKDQRISSIKPNYEFEDYKEDQPDPEPINHNYSPTTKYPNRPSPFEEDKIPQFGTKSIYMTAPEPMPQPRTTSTHGPAATPTYAPTPIQTSQKPGSKNNIVLFDSDEDSEPERYRHDDRNGYRKESVPVSESRNDKYPGFIMFRGTQYARVPLC